MTNIYKPRYKICYQVKNKVWINKNSKMGEFFNLRSPYPNTRKIVVKNNYVKNIRCLKSMKWVMVRRFLIPRVRNKIYGRFIYKNLLQKKQQLKKFYGRLQEYQLQHIFKFYWKQQKALKQNIFISVLEKRLDVILYRMKILPTIFSCSQFIGHQGVLINNNNIKSVAYPLQYGDIITFNEKHWNLFYNRLHNKLINRDSGHRLLRNFYYKNFLMTNTTIYKKKNFKNKFKLGQEIRKLKFRYIRLVRVLNYIDRNKIYPKSKIQILQKIVSTKINPKIITINKLISSFSKKNQKINYLAFEHELILIILAVQKDINKFVYLHKIQQLILFNFKEKGEKMLSLYLEITDRYKKKK